MKKLYYLFLLAMLAPMAAGAQLLSWETAAQKLQYENVEKMQTAISADIDQRMNQKSIFNDYLLQSDAKFKPLFQTIEMWSNGLFPITAFDYDPKSNTLAFVQQTRIAPQTADGETQATGRLRLIYSTDGGVNWTTTEILKVQNVIYNHPSLAIMNPTESSDFNDLSFLVFSNKSIREPFSFVGGDVFIWKPDNTSDGFEYPGVFSLQGYKWSLNKMAVWNDTEGVTNGGVPRSYAFHGGTLNPDGEAYQYGRYGVGYVDENLDPNSWSPNAWRLDQFKDPGTPNSSWNSPMEIDVDEEGNLYNVVYNIWADGDEDFRTIGVSKSTDQGATWSEFERVPFSVWKNYRSLQGHDETLFPLPGENSFNYYHPDNFPGNAGPYQGVAFKVTGVDKFSVAVRQVIKRSADNWVFQIAELTYDGGTWDIKAIDDNLTAPDMPLNVLFIHDTSGEGVSQKDVWYQNPRGHEIELASTADGQYLIAKWIKYTQRYKLPGGPYTMVGGVWEIDTLDCTDLFLAYKEVDGGTWSDPLNITKDTYFDKFTFIPSQVKDIRNVAVFKVHSGDTNSTLESDIARAYYPGLMRELVEDFVALPWIMYANIDLTEDWSTKTILNPTPGKSPRNIQEIEYVASLGVYPNPAVDDATITFELDRAERVTIEIHDAMGNIIATLKNNEMYTMGSHSIDLNVANLSSGAYFYTFRTQHGSATRLLNVVK